MIKGYVLNIDNEVIFFDEKKDGAELNYLSLNDRNHLIPVIKVDNQLIVQM